MVITISLSAFNNTVSSACPMGQLRTLGRISPSHAVHKQLGQQMLCYMRGAGAQAKGNNSALQANKGKSKEEPRQARVWLATSEEHPLQT
jgi:hypothetical protein